MLRTENKDRDLLTDAGGMVTTGQPAAASPAPAEAEQGQSSSLLPATAPALSSDTPSSQPATPSPGGSAAAASAPPPSGRPVTLLADTASTTASPAAPATPADSTDPVTLQAVTPLAVSAPLHFSETSGLNSAIAPAPSELGTLPGGSEGSSGTGTETPPPPIVDEQPSTPPVSRPPADGGTQAVLPLNKIALENLKEGTPREVWALKTDIGDANIQGFATDISTNVGGQVDFKIATDSTHYKLEIYRMGYYGGDGARLVDTVEVQRDTAQIQPHPIVDMQLGLIDAGNWSVSTHWDVPDDATSGVYFAKLVREDGVDGENIIPFVVRDDASTSDIVFQTSDTTWEAYNPWGGANLYGGDVPLNPDDMIAYMPPNCHCGLMAIGRAYAVSYNRPFITSTNPNFLYSGPQDFVFGEEFPAIEWLEQNGYDVSYISGVDAAKSGQLLLNHDVYMSVGHDEYWSGDQRANVTAARDAGVNLAFWSGNECYWKVQWNDSIDGNGTPYRTMTCYKETWANADINPADGSTATWRDPRFADPGQEPENSLTGTLFQVDSWRADTMTIPYDMTQFRLWRNTAVSETHPGDTAELVNGLLGYEWDSDVDNGFRPAGLVDLSLSNISVDTYLLDYGNTVGAADAQHSLTMYRDQQSGALVFSAGTVMWSWGLNAQHDLEGTPVDPNVQQAMVNMFADMGVQPTTLDASLILATQSTDFIAPTATVTSPAAGAAFVEGQKFTITGTAQDFGGGLVAGIEVSVDGGNTWHKANGTTNWSYAWIAQASGTYQIEARATDDSINLGAASAATSITVSLPSTSSLWTYANKPVNPTEYERNPVELGVRFSASTDGTVTGIRFYKGPLNGGPHVGNLWTSTGQLLATGTFTGESADGWQTLMLATPITVHAGQTYVASYSTNGYYAYDDNYFDTPHQNGLLSTGVGAGVYGYGNGDPQTFPGQTSDTNGNYWVDVVFNPAPNTAPVAGDDGTFSGGWNKPLTIDAAQLLGNDTDANDDTLTITGVGGASHGTVAFNAQTGIVTFTPTAGYSGTATFTYTVSDGRGGTDTGTVSLDIKEGIVGATLFNPTDAPTGGPESDPQAVELGVKFIVSASGTITGIRYYKSAEDTGTHVGSLWSATGQLLETATFTNESASGWQTVTFDSPVQVTAGTTYIASFHSNGHYVADSGYFDTAHTNGNLTAPSSADSGGNGLYRYGAGGLAPNESFGDANYWVDVTYDRVLGANHAPLASADQGYTTMANQALAIAAATLLANDNDPDGDPLTITGVSSASHGTVGFSNGTVTFTPTANYTGAAGFSYAISDGRGGTSSTTVSLEVQAEPTDKTLFLPAEGPSTGADGDPNPVELGMRFAVSANGTITGLRYYKTAGDTGTHTGSLWTASGQLLKTATFTNETASGWQTVTFDSPVTVTAGTTYVASYQSNGHYAATPNYFVTSHSNGGITAPSGNNGLFAYGSGNEFPNESYNATNYWVDVLYDPAQLGPNHDPVATADSGFTAESNGALTIAASALLANDNDQDGDSLAISAVSGAAHGAVSFDSTHNTVTFTPTAGYTGAASFSYTIGDGRGGAASATVSLNVQQAVIPDATLFSSSLTPTHADVHEPIPIELGLKFEADVAGSITGIRFYKAANENGAHEAHLWTASGNLLATVTFSNETASGWQTATLSQPVAIDADTEYVVSYRSNGDYAATENFFTAAVDNGHLHAPSDTAAGGNGVYAYGSTGVFPNETFGKTNYFVDVAFKPLAAA
ncbi:MAG TPA: DUF4082 domain-containing protein [Devosiaceae bacterium]|jgi:hypothetical protein